MLTWTLETHIYSVYIWVMITSNRKGQIAVSKAQVRAIELGFNPCIPVMDCRYDLVLDDGKKLWRVQVKYADGKATHTSGSVIVKLEYNDRTHHSYTYTREEIDALVVYIPKIGKLCWLSPEVYVGKKRLHIRIERPMNNQRNKVILASDYFW